MRARETTATPEPPPAREAPGRPGAESGPAAAVLVVDDEPGMRNFLQKALAPSCALVEVADSAELAESLRRRYHFDLIIVDIRLPGRSGVEWLTELRDRDVQCDVIVMTAYADLDTAITALRAGAADFLLKPFRLEEMMAAVNRCLERRRALRENFLLRRQQTPRLVDGVVGETPAIKEVCAVARRVAPTGTTILVEGETGTGKELVARAIHDLGGRDGAFVPVNCGSIPADLLESELFGHTRGAFTSASASREGLFSYAHGGTLFLDEISELSIAMQAKLLRAMEDKAIRPLGSDREVPVDARLVAATNRSLDEAVRAGTFRADLFYRLNVLTITVPPLRERREDIPLLASYFSAMLAEELGVDPVPFSHPDMQVLQAYEWPGNVRELRNVIERSLLLGRLPGDCCRPAHPAQGAGGGNGAVPIEWSLAEVERFHMLRVLDGSAGNKSAAARRLGVSRKTLERKLKKWRAADP